VNIAPVKNDTNGKVGKNCTFSLSGYGWDWVFGMGV